MKNISIYYDGWLYFFFLFFPLMFAITTHAKTSSHLKKAMFAGGCFWCMEKPFETLEGVVRASARHGQTVQMLKLSYELSSQFLPRKQNPSSSG